MITPPRTRPGLATLIGASLLLSAGCTSQPVSPTSASQPRLVAFESCEQAVDQLRAAARHHVRAWGPETARIGPAEPLLESAERATADTAAPAPGAGGHSATNVHEAGVDEPDLVKTDGRRIVTVSGGVLRVVDAQRRVLTGALELREPSPDGLDLIPWAPPAQLLLAGDRALVLWQESGWVGQPMPRPAPVDPASEPDRIAPPAPIGGPRLVLVDLAGAPRVIGEYVVDGELIDARATGAVARVVVRSTPRLALPAPGPDLDQPARLAAAQQVIDEAPISDWLPRFQLTSGDRTETGQVACTDLIRPASYSAASMLTVLTFDLAAASLGAGDPVSVVADGDTVYSNGSSLYVASDQRWRVMRGEPAGTEIYQFDLTGAGAPRYLAAGSVPGWLINQYALSEWEGHLRVATTDEASWGDADSESTVYVLAERGGELAEVGSVGGLGKTERIYSVRFSGPIGYVVTFRETDPLYTLDLRDPTAPAVLGELKITGYSSYLHPLDEQRLLGVGQEADERGVVQGTQVSLFDVSDLTAPAVAAQHHLAGGYSEVESDPHAFLWWPAEQLIVIPVQSPASAGSTALVLRVDPAGLVQLAELSHPAPGDQHYLASIRRSLVIDQTLWTVSELGLQANDLASFDQLAWLPHH